MISRYHTRESYERLYRRLSVEFGCDGFEASAMTNQELIASINTALKFLNCIPMSSPEVNNIVILLNQQS